MSAAEWAREYDLQEMFTWNLVKQGLLTVEQYHDIMGKLFALPTDETVHP